MNIHSVNRRPLSSRNSSWAILMASSLAESGVHPNSISVFSTVFAMTGAIALLFFPYCATPVTRADLLIATVAAIQLRLLCNLLDGMVAIECGLKTKSGEIFNEL